LRDAPSGARSRKSINVVRPSARRISIKPPPPMLPALGWVTASANPTAVAASIALPPFFKTCSPAAWHAVRGKPPCRAARALAVRPTSVRRPPSAAELTCDAYTRFYYAALRRTDHRFLWSVMLPWVVHALLRVASSLTPLDARAPAIARAPTVREWPPPFNEPPQEALPVRTPYIAARRK
jgi:hypothetical protein